MPPANFKELVRLFMSITNPLLVVLAGLALLSFFKGLVIFIAKSGDAKTHAEGKNLMIWGLIALFVMMSVMAIIQFAYYDFGFSRSFGIPLLPQN